MRRSCIAAAVLASSLLAAPTASADASRAPTKAKPWCGPDVMTLSDHVCYVDGGTGTTGRRTLVIYLHGVLAKTPGFQYVQQHWMAKEAKSNSFTLLMPTAPDVSGYYAWPGSAKSLKDQEAAILDSIKSSRAELEKKNGAPFDETFVVGFSSGAYYASSLAVRGALDVDGYVVLAGAGAWMNPAEQAATRAPVFVGVSAADPSSAAHSRGFAGVLAQARWPYRVETRNTGHGVDSAFLAHAITWLRGMKRPPAPREV